MNRRENRRNMNMTLLKCREYINNKDILTGNLYWGDENSKHEVNFREYIKIYKDKNGMEFIGEVPLYSFLNVSALIQREENVVEVKEKAPYYDSYYCPVCKDYVEPESNYCPHCGSVMGWEILNY